MKKDAEAHAEEDKKKKEAVEVRINADQLIYSSEKALKDAEGKIADDLKSGIQAKIDSLKTIKDGTDLEAIKKGSSELSAELMKIGEAMAKANQQTASDKKPEDTAGPEGKVRDAETK